MTGRIVILNGAPRAGKSSIARALQARNDRVWINLGVDAFSEMTPLSLRPGIGLRPGGERPDIEAHLPMLFAGLYEAIGALARSGLNVVSDLGHHDSYTRPLGLLHAGARRLKGLDVLFVGVRCPLPEILTRRKESSGSYVTATTDDPVPAPVQTWQWEVHHHSLYDIEVDTAEMTALACAETIARAMDAPRSGPSAFERLARSTGE